MKKRNQFLLRIGKAIGSTLVVALLGIGTGNFVRNNEPLLVKVDKIGMDHVDYAITNDKITVIANDIKPIGAALNVAKYTQSAVTLTSEFLTGPEMNACYFEGRRLGEIIVSNAKPNMPGVHKLSIARRPRGDTIELNTS